MSKPFKRGGGNRGSDDAADHVPPGDYLIGLVWFARKVANSGEDYLRARFAFCSGELEGQTFFSSVSLDTSKNGSCKRLELWMEAVGCDDEIDLDDDKAIAATFKGKAFKAKLVTRKNGQYTNIEIDRYIYTREYTEQDEKEIEAWEATWKERGWEQRDPTNPGRAPEGDGGGADDSGDPGWSPGSGLAPGAGDDDIPF